MFALKRLNGNKEADIHPFIAGLLGGYYVFGENNSINQQVCQSCIIINKKREMGTYCVFVVDCIVHLCTCGACNGEDPRQTANH